MKDEKAAGDAALGTKVTTESDLDFLSVQQMLSWKAFFLKRFNILFKYIYIYLTEWQEERALSIILWFLPPNDCHSQAILRLQKLLPGLSHAWWGLQYMGLLSLLSQARQQEAKEQGLELPLWELALQVAGWIHHARVLATPSEGFWDWSQWVSMLRSVSVSAWSVLKWHCEIDVTIS